MASSQSPSPAPVWSAEQRSWASLLIFAHLFALFVGVTTYTRPSGLEERLHELFAPYLRTLHMTAYPVSYPFARYHLTHALSSDVDFSCEVDIPRDDGSSDKVVIPQPGLRPLIRWRRYQALANAVGTLADAEGNEEFSGVLPKAIAGAILKQRGAAQGTIRCRPHYMPRIELMDDFAAGRPVGIENPTEIYEAQVFVSGTGVELLKKAATLEVAPVESKPKKSVGPPAPSGPQVPTLPDKRDNQQP